MYTLFSQKTGFHFLSTVKCAPIYKYTYIHTYTYKYTHIHEYTFVYIHTHEFTYIPSFHKRLASTYSQQQSVRLYIHTRTYIHLWIYTYTHVKTHIYIRISLHIYSQSHLGWHFRMLFQSSKLKAWTSLLPRFSEKRRSSFELWALKELFENVTPNGIGCTHLAERAMGWLRLVGSLKLQVSFAKETYKRDDILQKRPIILTWRSLLIVATP